MRSTLSKQSLQNLRRNDRDSPSRLMRSSSILRLFGRCAQSASFAGRGRFGGGRSPDLALTDLARLLGCLGQVFRSDDGKVTQDALVQAKAPVHVRDQLGGALVLHVDVGAVAPLADHVGELSL